MRSYDFINKEWIVSPTARRVYRISAAISLTLYWSVAALILNQRVPFLRQLLFLGVLGTAITVAGMECFLIRFDDSPAWQQIAWFLVMFCPPLGPALYCFLGYSRSQVVRNACVVRSDGALDGSKPFG